MRRQLSLDMSVGMSTPELEGQGGMTRAQRAFAVLPASNLFRAKTPDVVKDALRPAARRGALRHVTAYSDNSSYYGPTRFAPLDANTQLVGFYNGAVSTVDVDGDVRILATGGCPSTNLTFFYRCAVTALASLGGDDFVSGDFSGFLRIVRRGQANWIRVSDSRIAHVVRDGDGSLVVADGGGNLYRVGSTGQVQQLHTEGGAVAAMTHREGHIEIVRRRGVIQRLYGNRLSSEATRSEIFLGSAMSGGRRVFLHSLIVDEEDQLQRRDRFEVRLDGSDAFVAMTTENYGSGSVGGLEIADSEPGRPMIAGLGLVLYRIDLEARKAVPLHIASRSGLTTSYTGYGASLPRYFDATLGSAGGGRYIFTIDDGALAILDLEMLDRIDAIIDHSSTVRRDLCALGLGAMFAIAPSSNACSD